MPLLTASPLWPCCPPHLSPDLWTLSLFALFLTALNSQGIWWTGPLGDSALFVRWLWLQTLLKRRSPLTASFTCWTQGSASRRAITPAPAWSLSQSRPAARSASSPGGRGRQVVPTKSLTHKEHLRTGTSGLHTPDLSQHRMAMCLPLSRPQPISGLAAQVGWLQGSVSVCTQPGPISTSWRRPRSLRSRGRAWATLCCCSRA